jgi:hypothetical protein
MPGTVSKISTSFANKYKGFVLDRDTENFIARVISENYGYNRLK